MPFMQSLFMVGLFTLYGAFAGTLFAVHIYVNLPTRKPATAARQAPSGESPTTSAA